MNEDDIRELAKLLIDVVNEESNDYDARESVEDILISILEKDFV